MFVPYRAFRWHVSESFIWLWVRDGNNVFIVWSYHFLCICLLSEVSVVRTLAVEVQGEGEGARGRRAEWWVGDWKGWRQLGFGAGDCRMVTLDEVVANLVVSLLSRYNRLVVSATWNKTAQFQKFLYSADLWFSWLIYLQTRTNHFHFVLITNDSIYQYERKLKYIYCI